MMFYHGCSYRADKLFNAGLTITIDSLEQIFPEELKDMSKSPHVRLKLMCEAIYSEQVQQSLKKMEYMKVEESFEIPSQINYKE